MCFDTDGGLVLCCFFCQAEDGIRDRNVTGVQTCALPISRWRHFVTNGDNRWADIAGQTSWRDRAARARAEFDLAIVSVFLDAGAGPSWHYHDPKTGLAAGRSEGLALASLAMFAAGAFSADPLEPLRADAGVLANFSVTDL